MTPLNTQSLTPSNRPGGYGASATRLNADTVVCQACGCRLTVRESADDARMTDRSWWHYTGQAGRDARGCAIACADLAHQIA